MTLWFAVTAGLLVVSGRSKLLNPAPTLGALDAAGIATERPVATYLGVAEIAAGLAGLLVGSGIGAVPVGVLYLGFAGFVAMALARGWPIQSCGCFARIDTPPTWAHLAFDLAAAAGAVVQVVTRAPSPLDAALGLGWRGVLLTAAVVAGVAAAYHLVFVLPTRRRRRSAQRA